MEYIPYIKRRYQEKNIEEIYQRDYTDPNTIRLDFLIHEKPAFIVPTPEIFRNIIDILKLNKDVSLIRNNLPGAAIEQFTRRCLIDEIILSNGIEGVSSTRREINEVLDSLKTGHRIRFQGLVNKYQKLQEDETVSLRSCEDVRTLYDTLVLEEVLSENEENAPDGDLFRKDSVSVENAIGKTIHQGVFPENRIIAAMESALSFLNNEKVEALIRIAGFHYLFGYIHPFYDGNGRTSRFISSYLLSKELDPLIGYRLSYTIKEHISEYYAAFKCCNDVRNLGDITPFVIVFLEILREAMEQLKNALQERERRLKVYERYIRNQPLTGSEKCYPLSYLLLQASLFSERGIRTKELLQILEISRSTLKDRLGDLEDHGYVLSHRDGREMFYRLDLNTLASTEEKMKK